jgi:hypothetical protein
VGLVHEAHVKLIVIAKRAAPWQSMRRFNFLERRYNLNRLLNCHGPAALAFDEGFPVCA